MKKGYLDQPVFSAAQNDVVGCEEADNLAAR